jgi:enolase
MLLKKDSRTHVIKTIKSREILNSHVALTSEFNVEFEDGSVGMAASPEGETVSIYEDRNISIAPETIIKKMEDDGLIGKPIDLKTFDAYLERNVSRIGRNNAFGLSLAFFQAANEKRSLFELFDKPKANLSPPRLCCNILNGGWHAYTNPVLSDFHEYIFVAKSNEIKDVTSDHKEIQELVKERLRKQRKAVVAGNAVHRFKTADNRECIEFILKIREDLGLSDQYDLMIDASGSDLRTNGGYSLPITDKKQRSSEEFLRYWLDLISQYDLVFLEDPFCETDYDSWHELTTSQQACKIIGDNLYSSSAQRIARGATKQYTHGVVIKPNQSGTVTAVRQAIETSQGLGQIIITSHRSISTEETFVSALTCMYGVQYIKIGPLLTDYSSVLRLNEIMRLTKGANG